MTTLLRGRSEATFGPRAQPSENKDTRAEHESQAAVRMSGILRIFLLQRLAPGMLTEERAKPLGPAVVASSVDERSVAELEILPGPSSAAALARSTRVGRGARGRRSAESGREGRPHDARARAPE